MRFAHTRRLAVRRLISALVFMLLSVPALAAMQAKPVEWTMGKDRFSGTLVFDDGSAAKRPGLVMVPNWMGVNDLAIEKAKAVAGDDYVVLVADVYGKDARPKNAEEALAQVRRVYADGGVQLRARANEAAKVLKAQAGAAPLD